MSRLLNRLANLFLLCLGIFSLLAIIASSFQCRYDRSLWLWMLVLCVLLWVAGSFRRGFWIGMPIAAALLFLAYRFYGRNPMLHYVSHIVSVETRGRSFCVCPPVFSTVGTRNTGTETKGPSP